MSSFHAVFGLITKLGKGIGPMGCLLMSSISVGATNILSLLLVMALVSLMYSYSLYVKNILYLKEGFYADAIELLLMKIEKTNNKAVITLTKKDWIRIGQEAQWPIPDEVMEIEPPVAGPARIEVKKYGPRHFAVYVDGMLLAVTVYRKGAEAVGGMIDDLWQEIQAAEGRVKMVG